MALEGLSISHLGTRFWATTSVDKLKTLVTDNTADVAKAKHLKSIWAGSTRIGSLAQKGETGRFHDVFAAAKAFPQKVAIAETDNRAFLSLQLKENTGIINIDPEDRSIDNFADRIADIFAAKFPELVNNIERAKVSVRDVLLAVNESVDFTALREGVGNDTRLNGSQLADYKTSLTNATLGALRMIAEKGLSVDAVYTLGQKKVYDLSRRYDMYEIAWNTMKDAGLIPRDDKRVGVATFDVGDGSDKKLKSRLDDLRMILEQKLAALNGNLNDPSAGVVRKTLAAINFCLHLGNRERRLDKFAAKAHAVLDPLLKSAGERSVSFTGALTVKGGMDVGISKLTIEGKAMGGRDMSLSCGPDGISVTTLTGGGFEGSANFGFLDVPGAKTNVNEIPGKGDKAFGVHAKVAAGGKFRWGDTKTYRTTNDFIAAMKGHSELVESNRFFGFLRSIGRLIFRIFCNDEKPSDYEINQREFLSAVQDSAKDGSPLKNLDGFLSRQKTAVISSRRDFKRIEGGGEIEGGVNFGISKGMDEGSEENGQATFKDNRLVDASASVKLSGSRDLKVSSQSYQTLSEKYRSIPGTTEDFAGQFQSVCANLKFVDEEKKTTVIPYGKIAPETSVDDRRNQVKIILDYVGETLDVRMKELETKFAKDGKRDDFIEAWEKIAVQYELLRRRVDELLDLPPGLNGGGFPNDIMGRFDEVCHYMASRLDRPDVPTVTGDIFNEEIRGAQNNNSFKTTKVSVSISGGVGTGLGGMANDALIDKTGLSGVGGYVAGQALEKGVNTAAQLTSDILPTNLSFSFDFEWKTPIINTPRVPWENVAEKKTTVTFSPWCGIRALVNSYVKAQVKAGNVAGDIKGKTDSGTAGDRFRNEFLNLLGVSLQDSILDQPLNMLLKNAEVMLNPQLANFVKCAMTGKLTLTSVNGKVVSITSAKTQSSTSGAGIDVKLGVVSINASVSKTVSETKPAYTLVGAMPIDVVLARIDGHALVTRHQQLLNYLSGNPAKAIELARAIANPANNQTDEATRHKQATDILDKIIDGPEKPSKKQAPLLKKQLTDAKTRLSDCLQAGNDNSAQVLNALSTYLETLRDAFAFGVSEGRVYANNSNVILQDDEEV